MPDSCTRWKAAPSLGPLQNQVAQYDREDRALRRANSTVVKAEAEEGLQASILPCPVPPAPEASQGASCPRSIHPSSACSAFLPTLRWKKNFPLAGRTAAPPPKRLREPCLRRLCAFFQRIIVIVSFNHPERGQRGSAFPTQTIAFSLLALQRAVPPGARVPLAVSAGF